MTSWNNTANENAHIPKSIIICDELPPINNPAIINIHESLEPQFANGTNALLIEIGAYPFACCIACPHSCAATPTAATLSLA